MLILRVKDTSLQFIDNQPLIYFECFCCVPLSFFYNFALMIDEAIKGFKTITLEEMAGVKLMNRVDTKYVVHISKLKELLSMARDRYFIQEIDGESNLPYYTCYYDTPEADMYYQHQRGKKTRQKIRRRVYEGSDTPPFLEIKSKNNKGRTKKKRREMEEGTGMPDYSEFVESQSQYLTEELQPVIENHFYRITLVNHEMTERITIDTNLEFHNLITGDNATLPEICVIEWKRDGNALHTPLKELLRELRIHEGSFSKYCIGMALTNPLLPRNRIKKKIRNIEKISGRFF